MISKIFRNVDFKDLRVLEIDNTPYFVAKDIADTLGYQNGSRDINRHVGEEDMRMAMVFDGRQEKKTILINESGLYSLIISSKLPNAKKFKKWVTSEVLPSIRQNGGYLANQEQLTPEQIMANALKVAESIISQKDKKIEELQPKAIFADAVAGSDTSILIREMAKILKQNGIEMGERRLFEWLRNKGYLIRKAGTDQNTPTQRSMELGIFEIKESVHVTGKGKPIITLTPKVTAKGQIYILNKLKEAA